MAYVYHPYTPMTTPADFDKIELRLVRVLHAVITERSVSRAAVRLRSSQPVVSSQLARLRALIGDPLLVRAGQGMAPTDVALELLEPAQLLLQQAGTLFGARAGALRFEAATATHTLRIAASDYLDPHFLPGIVTRVRAQAPSLQLEILPLSGEFDYRRRLASGDVDLVIGNWLKPPEELHLGRLLSDEIVCLVAEDHPAVTHPRTWTLQKYLACDHVAPSALHPGALGVIDEHLAARGLHRRIVVRSAHFGLMPAMVAGSNLVMTTGRLFCARYLQQLPVRIVRCPVGFPSLTYYQLWHDLTQRSAASRWLRECVRDVARELAAPTPARARSNAHTSS